MLEGRTSYSLFSTLHMFGMLQMLIVIVYVHCEQDKNNSTKNVLSFSLFTPHICKHSCFRQIWALWLFMFSDVKKMLKENGNFIWFSHIYLHRSLFYIKSLDFNNKNRSLTVSNNNHQPCMIRARWYKPTVKTSIAML